MTDNVIIGIDYREVVSTSAGRSREWRDVESDVGRDCEICCCRNDRNPSTLLCPFIPDIKIFLSHTEKLAFPVGYPLFRSLRDLPRTATRFNDCNRSSRACAKLFSRYRTPPRGRAAARRALRFAPRERISTPLARTRSARGAARRIDRRAA